MPEIKFTHVVSCNSADQQHPAENLLRPQSYKKWKCKTGEKQAFVILQLEKSIQLQSLDIGNDGSAFIEILGGRSTTNDDDYKVLLPTAGFMTPDESRKETNLNGVRFFDGEKLTEEGRRDKWDRLKIVCTQPFNKNLAFGLSFVKVHATNGVDDVAESDQEKTKKESEPTMMGNFKLKDDVDERGISTRLNRILAPGALFSAKRKMGTDRVDEEQNSSSSKNEASFSGGSWKKDKSIGNGGKRKSIDNQKDDTPKRKESKISKEDDILKRKDSKKDEISKRDESKKLSTSFSKEKEKSASSVSEEETKSKSKQKQQSIRKNSTIKFVPFNRLLENVVFALSGFQNPLRGELRDRATEMGAKYRPDWDNGCTHLVCAFANTPKYSQVKGRGKIVKKDWILESHKRRRKLDWRKYAFEKNDEDDVSDEDELVADDDKQASANNGNTNAEIKEKKSAVEIKETISSDSKKPKLPAKSKEQEELDRLYNASTDYSDSLSSGADTDDEIERVRRAQQNASGPSTKPKPKEKSPKKKSKMEDSNDDDDDLLPDLPDFFADLRFFLYGGFSNSERKQLQRFIVAFNGTLESYMSGNVTHVLTKEKWDSSFDEALNDFSKIVFLKPEFVFDCAKNEKMGDISEYKVKKESR